MELSELQAAIEGFQKEATGGFEAVNDRLDEMDNAFGRAMLGGQQSDNSTIERDVKAAFANLYRTGKFVAGEGADINAAMSTGNDPEGGFLVSPDVSSYILKKISEQSDFRKICRVIQTDSDMFQFYRIGQNPATNGWVGEMESVTESEGLTGGIQRIEVFEQQACPHVTLRLLEDSDFDVGGLVMELLFDTFLDLENTAFVSGNGVNKPKGFLSYGADAVTDDDADRNNILIQYVPTGAAGAFPVHSGGGDDVSPLIEIQSKLNSKFRKNAVWLMNRSTEATIRKMVDNNGNHYWQPSIQMGEPGTLFGDPVVLAEEMPDIAANSLSIAYGDFSHGYLIADRLGMSVIRDPFTSKGQVKFFTRKRVGGDVVDFNAIKLLKFSAS